MAMCQVLLDDMGKDGSENVCASEASAAILAKAGKARSIPGLPLSRQYRYPQVTA